MDYLFDPNLCTAAVYLVVSCLYVRPHHGRWERSLATLAACKSDPVQHLHLIHHHPAPIEDRVPSSEIGLMANVISPAPVRGAADSA
jgi:hypothetical protein